MFKNILLRNHKGDEAETCHTCVTGIDIIRIRHLTTKTTQDRIDELMMIIIWTTAKDIIRIYLLSYKIHDLLTI